ncbi:MAG TPA: hypothetical protein VGI33_20870 [Paenibacillus sp.]
MKKISVAILSACLLLSTVSAASAAPLHETHEKKMHEKKIHAKSLHKEKAHKKKEKELHMKSHKTKTIKTKATKMPKSGFGGASEQTE